MIANLEQYFEKDYQFYLYRIKFDRIDSTEDVGEVSLNCRDSISVVVNNDEGVTLIITRKMYFDPNVLFELEVSFGVDLKFIQEKKTEVEWDNVDLASEFKKSGEFVLQNIMSRMSLLIGQITASFGQAPLMTPPGIPMDNSN